MNEIEILSHTVGSARGSTPIPTVTTVPGPVEYTSNLPPREPTLWVVLVNMYKEKLHLVLRGFVRDRIVFNPSAFYPFKGLYCVLTRSVYWKYMLLTAGCFSLIFAIVAGVLYIGLLPLLLLGVLVPAGPIGLVIVHIQWLLLSNLLANIVCKNIVAVNLKEHIFRLTVQDSDIDGSRVRQARLAPQIKAMESTKVDPTMQVFVRAADLTRSFLWKLALAFVALLPIVGPLVANQLSAVNRSFEYSKFYLFNIRNLGLEEARQYKYLHYTSYIYFGITAGWLEFLPFVSILTMTSNVVGAALWSVEYLAVQDGLLSQGD